MVFGENKGNNARACRVYPFVADGQAEYRKSQECCIFPEKTACDLQKLLISWVTGSWCPQCHNRSEYLHHCSGTLHTAF